MRCSSGALAWAALAVMGLLVTGPRNANSVSATEAVVAPPPGGEPGRCDAEPGPVAVGTAQWNGWGRDSDNSRYQPEPALRAADVPRLALKWAYGFTGAAPSGQPTVVDGRLFVTSANGRIYALDARTGCVYWTFDAAAGVHATLLIAELAAPRALRPVATPAAAPKPAQGRRAKHHGKTARTARSAATAKAPRGHNIDAHIEVLKPPCAVFFGDDDGALYALDAQYGRLLWKLPPEPEAPLRIVGAPTVYGKRLYLTVSAPEEPASAARGAVLALEITTGKLLWKTPTTEGSVPTFDAPRGLIYIANRDAIRALEMTDGRQRWIRRAPLAAEFRSVPILRSLPGDRQIILAADRTGAVYGLDPAHAGEILWQTEIVPERDHLRVDWGTAADHRNIYVSSAAGLTALNIATGKFRWTTPPPMPACAWGESHCSHAPSSAVTVMPGVAFSGSLDGHLRAYSTIGGKIVWDMDTARDYRTVNSVTASGGSLDHSGAIVVGGMLYVTSGFAAGGQSGNVLLAYSVDGK